MSVSDRRRSRTNPRSPKPRVARGHAGATRWALGWAAPRLIAAGGQGGHLERVHEVLDVLVDPSVVTRPQLVPVGRVEVISAAPAPVAIQRDRAGDLALVHAGLDPLVVPPVRAPPQLVPVRRVEVVADVRVP